jgi:hypothetical protein
VALKDRPILQALRPLLAALLKMLIAYLESSLLAGLDPPSKKTEEDA